MSEDERSSEDAAPDGGVEGTTPDSETLKAGRSIDSESDQSGLSIRQQFENIRLTRRRRVIGLTTLIGIVGYLLYQGAAATTLFEQELRWGAFADALETYFPVTSYAGVPFLDIGQYIDFIIELNLLYDPQVGGLLLQWPPDLWAFFVTELGVFTVFGQAGITLAMGFVGTLLGFPLALLFSILASERVTPFPFNFIFRAIMSFIRAIPAIVWALIFVPLASLSPVPATLAIGLNTVGNLGRLFVEDLEELEEGPIEAMQTTGAGSTQIVFFGMLSQVKTSFIAWTLYIFEINVRSAVTVGVLGAGGLGGIVFAQRAQRNFTELMATLFCIFLLIMAVEIFSQRLRARLRSDEEKRGLWELITGFPQRMAKSAMR
ncbi:MAG: phosphonate ABC transporter, permease protein PhnE [halophilic archaeon J07HX64]|nr:MAG: phosphonate ABC transporter, permease protein PhnE [halophilic archaeon J07HX64]